MALDDVLGVVLGGGRGTRLWPLTKLRAKPAVPIGGKYRLIDIPVSNCLNSGIHRVAILTQFNSVSLHRHIAQTYRLDLFHPGWVQILAAEQTVSSADWYQGTADAVRKQMFEIEVTGATDVLVLAGDHLYRMDYSSLAACHWESGADVTVAVKPVSEHDASRFGLVRINEDHQIVSFVEKPQTAEARAPFVVRDDPQAPYLGSMGLYMFTRRALKDLLDSEHVDFGSGVLPAAIERFHVFAYPFESYWEDIGTIRAFYEANLGLAQPNPDFSFHDERFPIYTHPRFLPGSRIGGTKIDRALICDGCDVDASWIENSLVGIRSVVGRDVELRDTVMMGADYYEGETRQGPTGRPCLGIGAGSRITGAIIDKNACIGKSVVVRPFPPGTELETEQYSVQDGIVVIPKDAVIPDRTTIAP